MSNRIPKIVFVLSCAFLALLYGFCAATYGWFPAEFLGRALAEFGAWNAQAPIDPNHHEFPARHRFPGAHTYGNAAFPDDVILLTSFWADREGRPGIRLVDRAGHTLHTWTPDLPALWPHVGRGEIDPSLRYVHGTWLFDNGDVLCNIEYLGLLRLNARGDVVWRLDRRTHHALQPTADGEFWVCAADRVDRDAAAARFPGLEAPLWEDKALLVTARGEVRREVSVLQAVFDSSYRSLLWSTQYAARPLPRSDLMHLNDVEPLPADIAAEYPLFRAGDLLVSMRFLNLVAVLGGDDGRVKWAAPAVFLEQHDPDFVGGGWISVYDNRTDWTLDGNRAGGSRLVAIQPHTGAMHPIYPRADAHSNHERRFYSLHGGKAQRLANDHWLITEPSAGRVFEIDEHGRTVWEWVQTAVGGMVSEVLEGTRYALTPAQVSTWGAR